LAADAFNRPVSGFGADRRRDFERALYYGARGVLVPSEATPPEGLARAEAELSVARTLAEAVNSILK